MLELHSQHREENDRCSNEDRNYSLRWEVLLISQAKFVKLDFFKVRSNAGGSVRSAFPPPLKFNKITREPDEALKEIPQFFQLYIEQLRNFIYPLQSTS